MLQVGASDDPASSSDFDVIARDLRDLSDLAAKQDPPIQLYVSSFLRHCTLTTDRMSV